jgi:hypothetical protein
MGYVIDKVHPGYYFKWHVVIGKSHSLCLSRLAWKDVYMKYWNDLALLQAFSARKPVHQEEGMRMVLQIASHVIRKSSRHQRFGNSNMALQVSTSAESES